MNLDRQPGRQGDLSIATPYGEVIVRDEGREITFRLFRDLRQSEHSFYLYRYVEQVLYAGVDRFNVDHLNFPTADKSISLARGKSRLDLIYYRQGKIYEVELKSAKMLGIDQTRRQLQELSRYCSNLILAVPDYLRDDAEQLLALMNLPTRIIIDTYPIVKEQ